MNPAERQLLSAVRAGDEAAFLTLYRTHTPKLFATAVRLLGRPADAEDAVQEAWLRAHRGLATYRGDSAFSTWLIGIGIRCSLEILRRRSPAADQPAEGAFESAPHATIDLERAIAALPDGYRTALVLHDIEGFTHEEIGTLLGVEAGTSKSQLFHARRALRQRLRPKAEGVST